MRLWVLSQLESSPGTELVLAAARRAGHAVELVHPADLWGRAGRTATRPFARPSSADAEPFELPELVFTRMGSASAANYLDALVALEAAGVPVINTPLALWASRDKLRAGLKLTAAGVPVPATLELGRGSDELLARAVRAELGEPPWVVKDSVGAKGEAVQLVDGDAALVQLAHELRERGVRPLAQRFVAESAGTDTRVLVVGGRAMAAMRRIGKPGDFRSNLHQGGSAAAVPLTDELAELAVRASAALGLEVAGVDLVESTAGWQVLEVNGSPGFAGIEAATGRDLSGELIAHLETRARG